MNPNTTVVPKHLDMDNDEGFIPVTNRKRHKLRNQDKDIKEKNISTPVAKLSPPKPTIIDLVTPRSDRGDPLTQPPTTPKLTFQPRDTGDTSMTVDLVTTPKPKRMEMNTITTFADILNDRIQEAMMEVDRRAHVMDEKQTKYESKLRSIHRRHDALRAKDEQRLTIRDSLLNQWETKMTLRARDLADLERRSVLDLAQREQDIARLNTKTQEALDKHIFTIENITTQNELAIRAWHEVEMQKFKDQLAEHQTEYKARTEDFCEEQLQNLESNLDSYAEHARGIQEKLLVRLRKDIQDTHTDTIREVTQQLTTPIPDDDALNPDHARDIPTPTAAVSTNPAGEHRSTDQPRWKNVDYEGIMKPPSGGGSRSQPPTNNDERNEATLPFAQSTQYQQDHTRGNDSMNNTWKAAPNQQTPSKWADPDFQISQLRKSSTPARIRGRDRKTVTVFYNSFVDFLKIHRVPIKILDDIRIDRLEDERETLYPMELHDSDPGLHHRYSAAIYARLEEEDVLDPMEPLFVGLLQMYNSRRDGYALLKAILATTLMVHTQDIGSISTPPTAQHGTTPYEYACSLNEFYRGQQQFNRSYTTREQATMYLQGMANDPTYTTAAQQLMHDIQQIP